MVQENYAHLLHTKKWKAKRELILKRDEYKCTCCHKVKETLYVHHRYYYAHKDGTKFMPWEYPNIALTTLCYSCHKQVHKSFIPLIIKL